MKKLIKAVTALGAPEDLILHGNLGLKPEVPNAAYIQLLEEEACQLEEKGDLEVAGQTRSEIEKVTSRCHDYVPAFLEIHISPKNDLSKHLITLTYDQDPSRMQQLAAEIKSEVGGITLYHVDQDQDLSRVPQVQDFSEDFAVVKENVELGDEMLEASIENNMERLYAAKFKKFQMTEAYKEAPCTTEDFVALFIEYIDRNYMVTMEFSSYYRWLHRSAKMLDAAGQPTRDAQEEAAEILARWEDMTLDMKKSQLRRVMKIHPHHYATFNALVDQLEAPRAA